VHERIASQLVYIRTTLGCIAGGEQIESWKFEEESQNSKRNQSSTGRCKERTCAFARGHQASLEEGAMGNQELNTFRSFLLII
jgi:hypothetical protein